MYDQITVKSFSNFIRTTESFDLFSDTVIFRGQPVQGNLVPSIARKNLQTDTIDKERKVFEQLQLMGASMLPSNDTSDLDLLVIAQHFGLKTRLLDWTSNPLAALWFACADPSPGDVYVYALEAHNLLVKDVYKNSPFSISQTRVFQPRLNNPRIVAQHGWFTLHRYGKRNRRFVPLEENPIISKHLTEIQIPEDLREPILRSLDLHGMSKRTLSPDLEGLCHYLNSKYELS